ncbi:MAG TPA: hypothetical protein VEY90_05660 [Thermoleophilaceae bacterium]|nr:hypothetical protein [Thermoleophilaceae bacterium]
MTAEIALVIVAGVGAGAWLVALAGRLPANANVFESALRPPVAGDPHPAQLVRLERVVTWSSASALDAHNRLRPVLTEIAAARLARRGLNLEREPAEARRLLGATTWELLRPDRPPPRDRGEPGLEARELEQILDALEEL